MNRMVRLGVEGVEMTVIRMRESLGYKKAAWLTDHDKQMIGEELLDCRTRSIELEVVA